MLVVVGIIMTGSNDTLVRAQEADAPKRKVLFAVTSHDWIAQTGESTGFYLSEVAHPWEVLVAAGYEIDFVSPKGGESPMTGFDLDDPVNRRFWDDKNYRNKIEHTKKPSEINPDDYLAVHFAGGHGVMWDFPDDAALAGIATRIYENNGVVSAVCHGPAGLVNIRLPGGKYLVEGKRVSGFTNEEEAAVKHDKVVPFLLETRLIQRSAIFEKDAPWKNHAVTDQRIVTGQNPQSAKAVGEAVLKQLKSLEVVGKLTRFAVKPAYQDRFEKALEVYVLQALSEDANIQAEAYYEQGDRSKLWLIERWRNRKELSRFDRSRPSKAVESLRTEALGADAEVHFVTDLEPISKSEWRRTARAADRPLTVMLFVDSKQGTQGHFKAIYHAAMPQFRSEPGVVTYQLSQVGGAATRFVTFEKFRSPEAFQYHLDFPPIKPVIDYLNTGIEKQPFQAGLHTLVEIAPMTRE